MDNLWTPLLGLLLPLIGYFLFNKKTSSTSAQDEVLKYRQSEGAASIEAQKASVEKLKEDHKVKQEDLSPGQAEEYWRKKE